jgi:16S rRNA (adenine1518-N6/adenine1519-N6)-dimethyltransferase
MDLTSPKIIKEILEKHKAKANKILGQNFLIDRNILNKIISASDIKKTDTVLEVGPGVGTLTQELAKYAKQVIAVEKDKNMIEILKETLVEYNNVNIIEGDILEKPNSEYIIHNTKYKVIANIPYYLTSPLIRKFLESENPPEFMVLMVQKEVAQRICSIPPSMNLLAVSVQFYAEPKIISYVSKNSFMPAPNVDSAIIKITPSFDGASPRVNQESFFKVVKAGFAHPRKQLLGNLSSGLKLSRQEIEKMLLQNGIKPNQRAQTLSIQDWEKLVHNYLTIKP